MVSLNYRGFPLKPQDLPSGREETETDKYAKRTLMGKAGKFDFFSVVVTWRDLISIFSEKKSLEF